MLSRGSRFYHRLQRRRLPYRLETILTRWHRRAGARLGRRRPYTGAGRSRRVPEVLATGATLGSAGERTSWSRRLRRPQRSAPTFPPLGRSSYPSPAPGQRRRRRGPVADGGVRLHPSRRHHWRNLRSTNRSAAATVQRHRRLRHELLAAVPARRMPALAKLGATLPSPARTLARRRRRLSALGRRRKLAVRAASAASLAGQFLARRQRRPLGALALVASVRRRRKLAPALARRRRALLRSLSKARRTLRAS